MHNTTPNPTPSAQHTPRPTKCRPGPAAAAVTVETAAPPRNGPAPPAAAAPLPAVGRQHRPASRSPARLPAQRPRAAVRRESRVGSPLCGAPGVVPRVRETPGTGREAEYRGAGCSQERVFQRAAGRLRYVGK